jgi:hypothetical protein
MLCRQHLHWQHPLDSSFRSVSVEHLPGAQELLLRCACCFFSFAASRYSVKHKKYNIYHKNAGVQLTGRNGDSVLDTAALVAD